MNGASKKWLWTQADYKHSVERTVSGCFREIDLGDSCLESSSRSVRLRMFLCAYVCGHDAARK